MEIDVEKKLRPCRVQLNLEGKSYQVLVKPGETLLKGLLAVGIRVPHACQEAGCGQCRTLLKEGKVTMKANNVLEEDELSSGLILTCQSLPITESITIDYDAIE